MKTKVLANRHAPRTKRFLEVLQERQFHFGDDKWSMSDFSLGGRLAARYYCRRGVMIVTGSRAEVRR